MKSAGREAAVVTHRGPAAEGSWYAATKGCSAAMEASMVKRQAVWLISLQLDLV